MMKKILVTGANGQLGSELRFLTNENSDFIFTDVDDVNICNLEETEKFVLENDIKAIVNCAAYTNVDKAEEEEDVAYLVNTVGPSNLANICSKHGLHLVHISTDYVFNGRKPGSYSETDRCDPVSAYGRTKRAAELAIKKSGCKGIIIRTAWLYSTYGKNFVKKMLELSEDEFYISVVADQKGSPTYARDLAAAILEILPQLEKTTRYGEIFHFSNEGQCTWFEFAEKIMSLGRIDTTIEPITTADYPTPAVRPANSLLDKSLIKAAFGIEIPTWGKSLAKMMKALRTN